MAKTRTTKGSRSPVATRSAETALTRLHKDLVAQGNYLAARAGVSTYDYLSGLLRPALAKEMDRVGHQVATGKDGQG